MSTRNNDKLNIYDGVEKIRSIPLTIIRSTHEERLDLIKEAIGEELPWDYYFIEIKGEEISGMTIDGELVPLRRLWN